MWEKGCRQWRNPTNHTLATLMLAAVGLGAGVSSVHPRRHLPAGDVTVPVEKGKVTYERE